MNGQLLIDAMRLVKIQESMPPLDKARERGTPMPDLPVEFMLDTVAAMNEEPIKADSVDEFFDAL